MTGERCLELTLELLPPRSRVLDVGAGGGHHARRFLDTGHRVMALDIRPASFRHPSLIWVRADLAEPWPDVGLFNLVWCSHVLEHLPDVGAALAAMRDVLAPDGLLALTVPPRKDAIVGGHVNLFNLGLLAYRLVLAGFDCSKASLGRHGYNLSAVVSGTSMVPAAALGSLTHDKGDIERLAPYFPVTWEVYQGFDGALVPPVGRFTLEEET